MARKPRAVDFSDDIKGKLQVNYLPLTELAPAERNARTHSQEQIAQLVASISAFGWTNPILIDEDRAIIAGHGRLEAAKAAGLSEVPTITLTGLSAAQKRALAIADNKLALNAGWDDELLRLELGELGLEGFDLSLIGFSELELKACLGHSTATGSGTTIIDRNRTEAGRCRLKGSTTSISEAARSRRLIWA
jgi:hypothetical protein